MAGGWGLLTRQLLLRSLATGLAFPFLLCLRLLPKETFCCQIWGAAAETNQLCSGFACKCREGLLAREGRGSRACTGSEQEWGQEGTLLLSLYNQPHYGLPPLLKLVCAEPCTLVAAAWSPSEQKYFLQASSAVAQGWRWALLAGSGAVIRSWSINVLGRGDAREAAVPCPATRAPHSLSVWAPDPGDQ